MKTGPHVHVLHAHAWMATTLIDAYARIHLCPRHKTGTTLGKMAGHLMQRIDAPAHTTRTRGWRFLKERRVHAKCAYARGVILLKIF